MIQEKQPPGSMATVWHNDLEVKIEALKLCVSYYSVVFVTSTMAYHGQGQKAQKGMVQPINLIFRYLQNRSRIQVWLHEQVDMRTEGCIIGFDST
ncbi:hypothetical protein STEG23_013799 [Scotinomys teguina]